MIFKEGTVSHRWTTWGVNGKPQKMRKVDEDADDDSPPWGIGMPSPNFMHFLFFPLYVAAHFASKTVMST
jgi:hypothetical protein